MSSEHKNAIEELKMLARWARQNGLTSSANSAFKAIKTLERGLQK